MMDFDFNQFIADYELIFQKEVLAAFPGKEDWTYRDIPWNTKENIEKMLELAGQGQYNWLAVTKMKDGFRGQIIFSPTAIENFREYNKNG